MQSGNRGEKSSKDIASSRSLNNRCKMKYKRHISSPVAQRNGNIIVNQCIFCITCIYSKLIVLSFFPTFADYCDVISYIDKTHQLLPKSMQFLNTEISWKYSFNIYSYKIFKNIDVSRGERESRHLYFNYIAKCLDRIMVAHFHLSISTYEAHSNDTKIDDLVTLNNIVVLKLRCAIF